ncbi:MAG: hypothetical protein U5R14_08915 [Gemmatimonadota bacterium]|nr:hypothetical protein [Gemmatimonadota bacterium]
MNRSDCGAVRDMLPDVVGTDGAAHETRRFVERHTAECESCAAELVLIRELRRTRPEPSTALATRLEQVVRYERQAVQRPWWALTAAAVAALMLGIAVSSEPAGEVVAPAFAIEAEENWPWASADGLVAGGPVFDDLSDEALGRLLEDLSDNPGGA